MVREESFLVWFWRLASSIFHFMFFSPHKVLLCSFLFAHSEKMCDLWLPWWPFLTAISLSEICANKSLHYNKNSCLWDANLSQFFHVCEFLPISWREEAAKMASRDNRKNMANFGIILFEGQNSRWVCVWSLHGKNWLNGRTRKLFSMNYWKGFTACVPLPATTVSWHIVLEISNASMSQIIDWTVAWEKVWPWRLAFSRKGHWTMLVEEPINK